MTKAFKKGDNVTWRSQAGETHGKVVEVHTSDVEFLGKHRPASKDEPQYEVESAKSGHRALHHGGALKKV